MELSKEEREVLEIITEEKNKHFAEYVRHNDDEIHLTIRKEIEITADNEEKARYFYEH